MTTMTEWDRLKEWLGLGEGDRLQELGCAALPAADTSRGHGQSKARRAAAPGVGLGAVAELEQGVLDQLLSGKVDRTPSRDLDDEIPGWDPAWGQVRCWEPRLSVVIFDLEDALLARGDGEFRAEAGLVVADREAGARLVLETPGGEVVLQLGAQQLRVFAVLRSPSAAEQAREDWVPPPPPVFELPGPDALLQGIPAEPWLREAAARLAAGPSPVERAAALGLVARLHVVSGLGSTPLEQQEQLQQEPVRRLQALCAGWSAAQVEQLEGLALFRVEVLGEQLEGAIAAVDEGDPAAGPKLSALLLERDDLECVRFTLRLAGGGEVLGEALEALDERASTVVDRFDDVVLGKEEERLRQVAWQEPWTWWSSFTGW